MKIAGFLCLSAVISVAPVGAAAQSTDPVTRAQVREELGNLEQLGYNPGAWMHYPQNLRVAEDNRARQANRRQGDLDSAERGTASPE